MGAFFTNLHVRSDDRDTVAETLQTILREPAYLTSPQNGWVSLFAEETEDQGDDLERIGAAVSLRLKTKVLCFLVHDSDIFCYWLFDGGERVDQYNSNPHYFERDKNAKALRGVPETLLPVALPGVTLEQIAKTLRAKPLFAEHIVLSFAPLLGINAQLSTGRYRKWEVEQANAAFDMMHLKVGAQNQEYLNRKLRELSPWRDLVKLQELIDAGADINAPTPDGCPMLVRLAHYCHVESMRVLISAGADVNIRGSLGMAWHISELDEEYTPLMAAAKTSRDHPTDQIETVRLLLDSGADIHARSNQGRTALDLAIGMLDWRAHQGRIGRHAPEDVLKAAAERTAEVVRMLREAGGVDQ